MQKQRWNVAMGRRAGWACVVCGLAAPFGVSVYAFATMGWRGASALPGFVLGGLFALAGWRFLVTPSIAAEDEGIAVQNPFAHAVVPWSDVIDVLPGYSGLIIRRESGPPVVAWAVQKANAAKWLKKRTRADEVAEALMEVVQSHQRSSSSGLVLPG